MNTDYTSMTVTDIILQDGHLTGDFTEDLFNDEGPFGEADCAGL